MTESIDQNTSCPQTECPHCGGEMSGWTPPEQSSWGAQPQLVCFNDECPYFIRGWEWMMEKFMQRASYRYKVDPASGAGGPLPVWSKDALKDRIIPGAEEA